MSQPEEKTPPVGEQSLAKRLASVAASAAAVASSTPPVEEHPASAISTPAPSAARRMRFAPHAARHASRARRTWIALLFFPVFIIYIAFDAIRDLRDRVTRERLDQIERRSPFQRPDEMGELADRSMADVVAAIERFPFRPANISTQHAFFRDNGADAIGALLSPNPQINTFPHFYPSYFQHRLFEGEGGHQLAGMQAMHDHEAPALIICHGLLMTKNFDVIIQIARRAFEQWGFHVVTLDLRGWGQSAWTTDAPASAGYFEGFDIVEVCRELKRNPLVTSVGGIGYSLGGASMYNAARVSSQADDRPLDGGVVAISAPTDISKALRYISTKPSWRHDYFGLWHVFRAAIKGNVRRRSLPRDLGTWYELVDSMSSPYYDVTMDEFCARASATTFVGEIDQPVLHLHSADDFLVTVDHAYEIKDAAGDNPWVHVMVRDSGAHCSFAAVDPSWFHTTTRRWLEYWATPAGAVPADAPLD